MQNAWVRLVLIVAFQAAALSLISVMKTPDILPWIQMEFFSAVFLLYPFGVGAYMMTGSTKIAWRPFKTAWFSIGVYLIIQIMRCRNDEISFRIVEESLGNALLALPLLYVAGAAVATFGYVPHAPARPNMGDLS